MSDGERVGWLFLLIPPAAFVCAAPFWPRYFICILPGVAVAFACLMYRLLHDQLRVSAMVLFILLCFGGLRVVSATRYPEQIHSYGAYQDETIDILQHEQQIRLDGKRLTLIPFSLVLPVRYYSHHPERYLRLNEGPVDPRSVVPSLSTDDALEHAREIAFVNPDPGFLARLTTAKLTLKIQSIGSVTLVYAE